jgi:hypothetical protein
MNKVVFKSINVLAIKSIVVFNSEWSSFSINFTFRDFWIQFVLDFRTYSKAPSLLVDCCKCQLNDEDAFSFFSFLQFLASTDRRRKGGPSRKKTLKRFKSKGLFYLFSLNDGWWRIDFRGLPLKWSNEIESSFHVL